MTNKEWVLFLLVGVLIVGISDQSSTVNKVDSDFRSNVNNRYEFGNGNSYTAPENTSSSSSSQSSSESKGTGSKQSSDKGNKSSGAVAYYVNQKYTPKTMSVYSLRPGATVRFITRCGNNYSSHQLLGSQSSYTIPWSVSKCVLVSSDSPVGVTY